MGGRRVGVWSIYTSSGVRVHEITYSHGVVHGIERMWYSLPEAPGRLKAENHFERGQLNGSKRSWFANGRKRAEFLYEAGELVEARAWYPGGNELSRSDAETRARRDLEFDRQLYESLETFIAEHRPTCPPATLEGTAHAGRLSARSYEVREHKHPKAAPCQHGEGAIRDPSPASSRLTRRCS